MILGGDDAVVLRVIGLYDNFALRLTPAGSASHLREEVEGALPGAEIR